ncbi:hypothetical protein HYT59_02975 [Candidatus Woesebacteria bacterium]|nr:hypothetical protein [Candidatus Woesebacteria bacterium]
MSEEGEEKPDPIDTIGDLRIATLGNLMYHPKERKNRLDFLEDLENLHNLIGGPLGKKQKSEVEKVYSRLVEEGPDLFTEEEWEGRINPVVLEPIRKTLFPPKDL